MQFPLSSLIYLSFSSPGPFRFTDTYVHPDLFDSNHWPIIHKINCVTTNHFYSPTNWGFVDASLNRSLDSSNSSSIELFHKNVRGVVTSNYFKYKVQRRDNPFPLWWDSQCACLFGQKSKFLRLAKTNLTRERWISYKDFAARLRRQSAKRSQRYCLPNNQSCM